MSKEYIDELNERLTQTDSINEHMKNVMKNILDELSKSKYDNDKEITKLKNELTFYV